MVISYSKYHAETSRKPLANQFNLLVIESNGEMSLGPVADINIALMKPAQLSSMYSKYPYANGASAVDGNKATHFNSQSCTHTQYQPAENKPWWKVYLGQLYHVHSVELTNRLGKYVCWWLDQIQYERHSGIIFTLWDRVNNPKCPH